MAAVKPYDELLLDLADETVEAIRALIELAEAQALAGGAALDVAELVAAAIADADERARAIAWQVWAEHEHAVTGTVRAVAPAPAHAGTAEVVAVVNKAMGVDDVLGKLSQIVHGTTSWHAADESSRQLKRSTAKGWRRGLDGQACQMCRWWERDGRIWPAGYAMPRHTGCRCRQIAVWTDSRKIKAVKYSRADRRARAAENATKGK